MKGLASYLNSLVSEQLMYVLMQIKHCSLLLCPMEGSVRTFLGPQCAAPQGREDAVRPVVGSNVQSTKHLWGSDGLGVHPHLTMWLPTVSHGLH